MDTTELSSGTFVGIFGFSNARKCPNELSLVYSGAGRILVSMEIATGLCKQQYVNKTT